MHRLDMEFWWVGVRYYMVTVEFRSTESLDLGVSWGKGNMRSVCVLEFLGRVRGLREQRNRLQRTRGGKQEATELRIETKRPLTSSCEIPIMWRALYSHRPGETDVMRGVGLRRPNHIGHPPAALLSQQGGKLTGYTSKSCGLLQFLQVCWPAMPLMQCPLQVRTLIWQDGGDNFLTDCSRTP